MKLEEAIATEWLTKIRETKPSRTGQSTGEVLFYISDISSK